MKTKVAPRRKSIAPTDEEEAHINTCIAADSDNPKWNAEM